MQQVEAVTGASWWRLDPCNDLGHARAVLGLSLSPAEVGAVTVGELDQMFADAEDDLPSEYDNGIPADGRPHDQWVVWCAYRFRWPPDVTERQTYRNLKMLNEAADDGD